MKEEQGLGSNRKGFTIIELMVALVFSFILIGAVYGTFTSQQKAYTVQDQVAETQQNARMAMNILVRDIRMAGYGMPDTGVTIGSPAKTYDNAIKITKDGMKQSFDSITIVGAFGAPSGYLDRTLSLGSTELFLRSSDEALNFDAGDNKYIFIGGIDRLEVTGLSGNRLELNAGTKVRYPTAILKEAGQTGDTDILVHSTDGLASGEVLSLGTETITITAVAPNTITVDTDLEAAGNQGISGNYPAGTIINPVPVFRVTAVEYSIDNDSDPQHEKHPAFTREDRGLRNVSELAGNIQDLQITPDDQDDQSSYTITLTAQTRAKDPDYINPVTGDHYRTRQLQSVVSIRNL